MTQNTCSGCRHFCSEDKKRGACRRFPPKVFMLGLRPNNKNPDEPSPITVSNWPFVLAAQWCGEWAAKDAEARA